MNNIKLSTLLTLSMSFCLSTLSYVVAQPDDIPVQHLEFKEMVIHPDVEVYEFDEFIIEGGTSEIVMPEGLIIADASRDLLDDPEAWCFIHPDDPTCLADDDEDSDDDSDEEYGC